ncbi:MAG: DegV family protein [Clostridiales bacterium]|nr:DegV family protein [Clostridiales bacterium]
MNKIILSADSICDLNQELIKDHNVNTTPYTIIIGENMYKDNVDISPSDIYKAYSENKILPKTTSINVGEYYDYFKPWIDDGYEVIHITLASVLTSSYNNCTLAAEALDGVYTLDSQNLSVGTGLLVIKAAELIKEGLSAKEIIEELEKHREKIHMSFILNTLDFLHAGGRCSKIASLGSNILKIKPVINVDNSSGSMSLGNKYRGSLDRSILRYIKNKLSTYDNINEERIFIVHSGIDESYIEIAKNTISEMMDFKEIHVTTASCTISSHCGPNTLGISFETK